MEDKDTLSIEPEIITLSLILNHPDLIYSVEGLKYYMYSVPTHQNIFSIMSAVGETHSSPDLAMVMNYANSLKKLEACGEKLI